MATGHMQVHTDTGSYSVGEDSTTYTSSQAVEDSSSVLDQTSEQFVGNLCAYISLPAGHAGEIRKGNLMFDACFEGGNLGRVDYISETEYDLFIRPDTCNPRFRLWFNFTVSNVEKNQRVIFNLVNFSKTKSLYRAGMTPFVRSTSRPNWCRLPSANVFYYRSPQHQRRYVLSFAFAFDRDDDVYQFSYNYTYSYTRCQHYLDAMELQNLPWFNRQLLCYSVQRRRVDILTITNPDNVHADQGGSTKPHRMVFITARTHPGESPTSLVCQGVIDYLCGESTEAKLLRDNIVFKIVPMLNPDGVYLGNYRCSLMGFDLNRHWDDPSPWAHPTVHATKQQIMDCDRDPNTELDFYIDVHAHSTLSNVFIVGNLYSGDRFDQHMVLPKLLSNKLKNFSWRSTSFNEDSRKAKTGRRFLGGCLSPHTNCYTLEVSLFGSSAGDVHFPFSEADYMDLGRNLARTFLDYYRICAPTDSGHEDHTNSD